MRSYFFFFLALVALSVLFFAAGCAQDKPGGPPPAAGAPEVSVLTLQPAPVTLTTELSGRTVPYVIAEVRPQADGIVLKRFFVEGSDVKADTPLYQIDPDVYQARLNSAKAALEKARANVEAAKPRAERYRQMLTTKATGQQDYDDARAAYKQAEADVTIAIAELENATIQLERTRVLAPISGRIGRSGVTQGALVTANQAAPLAVIQQLDPIYVDVTRSSAELLRLKRELASSDLRRAGEDEAEVRLILEDGSVYPHKGKLQFSDVTVNQSTGSITLRAIFPNPDHDLLPGMYVRASLDTARHEKAILVPQQALNHDAAGNAGVLVVHDDGSVEQRVVKTLRALGGDWVIQSGVKAGERIIMEGSQRVIFIPGQPAPKVTAQEFSRKPAQNGSASGADPISLAEKPAAS